nr:putative ankyrin repeat protein [Quercus suber]
MFVIGRDIDCSDSSSVLLRVSFDILRQNGWQHSESGPNSELGSSRLALMSAPERPPSCTMAFLNDKQLAQIDSATPLVSLDCFDFDAVLDPSDSCLFNNRELSAEATSLIYSIEDASEAGNLLAVKKSHARLRQLVEEKDHVRLGRSLLLAVERQQHDVIAYLLSEGIEHSYYEVKRATLKSDRMTLHMLFEKAWDINQELRWDEPPALACAVEDADLTAWFLARGANPNASCMMNRTPLSAAVKKAPFPVVEMLFDFGGDIEQGSLLHEAVWRKSDDREAMLEYLILQGASVNAIDLHNKPTACRMHEAFGLGTPLHTAAAKGDVDTLRVLLKHGARLDIQDSCGHLALERAEGEGHEDAAQYLRGQTSLIPRL